MPCYAKYVNIRGLEITLAIQGARSAENQIMFYCCKATWINYSCMIDQYYFFVFLLSIISTACLFFFPCLFFLLVQ